MPLTATQQAFLDNYVRKHPIKARGKKKRAGQFGPARDLAAQQLALMQQVPGYAGFQAELAAVDTLGERLKFNEARVAAEDLTQRMAQAQTAFMNSGVTDATAKINALNVNRMTHLHGEIDNRIKVGGTAQALIADLAPIPAPDLTAPDMSDAGGKAARGLSDWAGATANRIQAKRRRVAAARIELAKLNKDLADLRTSTTGANAASTQIVALLDALTQSWVANVPQAPLQQATALYDAKVPQKAALQPLLDPTTPRIVPPTPRIDAAATAMATQLAQAIAAAENHLTAAQQQVAQTVQNLLARWPENSPAHEGATDALALLQAAPAINAPVNPPQDFDSAAFFGGALAAAANTPIADAAQFARQARVAEQALLAEVQQRGYTAQSDEVFDLKLKTQKDFLTEFCKAVGWAPGSLTPEQKAKAMSVAQGCLQAVRTLGNDRIAAKGQPVTLGGQTFTNGRFLAQGGLGEVWEYEDATDPTKKIVLKNALRGTDEDRADLQQEIKAHRQLMKAPPGTPGRANIVELKGAIVGDDGKLYFAMEKVEGGDLEQNRAAASVASDQGVLPEQVRQLLNQRAAKEAIEGLMFMRDQNAVHFDLKGANIMVAGDGTVKVADFGSTAFGSDAAGTVTDAEMGNTTPGYEAPERFDTTDKSHRFDTHSMGKVMQIMQTGADALGEESQLTGSLRRIQEAMTNPDPSKRPSLEAVLATSHFKNLAQYDDAKVKQLVALNAAYTQALAVDGRAVFDNFMANDLATVGPLPFRPNNYVNLIGTAKEALRIRETQRRELVAEKEAPNVDLARVAAIDAELRTIRQQVEALRALPARFGQSAQAKQIADRIRALSTDLMNERARTA